MWSGFSSEIETRRSRRHDLPTDQRRMWSGFSSEIETGLACIQSTRRHVACGAASRLRLKHEVTIGNKAALQSRMWSGFSSEIETHYQAFGNAPLERSHVERLLV